MKNAMGLDAGREFRRSQRHKECQQRGYHVRSRKSEFKTLGSELCLMELCQYCDVWVEASRLDWQSR